MDDFDMYQYPWHVTTYDQEYGIGYVDKNNIQRWTHYSLTDLNLALYTCKLHNEQMIREGYDPLTKEWKSET
jgi:hypothetical protein